MEFSAIDITESMIPSQDKCSSIFITPCIIPEIPRTGLTNSGDNDMAKIHRGKVS